MCAGRTRLGCLDIRGFTGSSLGSLQLVSDKNGPDVRGQDGCATRTSLPLRLRRRGHVNHPRLSANLTEELRREIVNDSMSEKGRVGSVRPAGLVHRCGDSSRPVTTRFNRPSVCFHSRAAQYSRALSSNRKRCPAPFVIPAVH